MTDAKKTEAEVILSNSKEPVASQGADGTPFVMLPPEWKSGRAFTGKADVNAKAPRVPV